MSSSNDTFLGDRELENESSTSNFEPAELIISRVVFALLVSLSLVMNLLLLLAVIRRRNTVHVIYCLAAAMLLPDLVFYCKLILELVDWGSRSPSWAQSDGSCAAWQFATHWYPIAYSVLLLAIVYHAFVTLFLDYSGGYEESRDVLIETRVMLFNYDMNVVLFKAMILPGINVCSRSKQLGD